MPVVSWPIGVPGEGPLVHRDLRFAIVPLQNNANYVETQGGGRSPGMRRTYLRATDRMCRRLLRSTAVTGGANPTLVRVFTSMKHRMPSSHPIRSISPRSYGTRKFAATIL